MNKSPLWLAFNWEGHIVITQNISSFYWLIKYSYTSKHDISVLTGRFVIFHNSQSPEEPQDLIYKCGRARQFLTTEATEKIIMLFLWHGSSNSILYRLPSPSMKFIDYRSLKIHQQEFSHALRNLNASRQYCTFSISFP